MKLRNKKTGEIGNLVLNINPNRESYSVLSTENDDTICGNLVIGDYDTISELNEEWEDYKEPKVAYFIDSQGRVCVFSDTHVDDWTEEKQIGNKFKTEEEAKKAVEKLKAWQRLKDNGFEFTGWKRDYSYCGDFTITAGDQTWCDDKDLELLFGGEE